MYKYFISYKSSGGILNVDITLKDKIKDMEDIREIEELLAKNDFVSSIVIINFILFDK